MRRSVFTLCRPVLLSVVVCLAAPNSATTRELRAAPTADVEAMVASVMQRLIGDPGSPWADRPSPLRVSMTLSTEGAQLLDAACPARFMRQFEEQVAALATATSGRMVVSSDMSQADIAIVMGDFKEGAGRPLLDALERRHRSALAMAPAPAEERESSWAWHHRPGTHEIRGVYLRNRGELFSGDVSVDWESPKFTGECDFNFVEAITDVTNIVNKSRVGRSHEYRALDAKGDLIDAAAHTYRAAIFCWQILRKLKADDELSQCTRDVAKMFK